MDDALVMGVLDRLTDWPEQLQPLLRGELAGVAELRDRDALDQLHDEAGRPLVGDAAVENLGDVGMIHESQSLPFGVEACQYGARVHARLGELDGAEANDTSRGGRRTTNQGSRRRWCSASASATRCRRPRKMKASGTAG